MVGLRAKRNAGRWVDVTETDPVTGWRLESSQHFASTL
jgi:hypothetical protein